MELGILESASFDCEVFAELFARADEDE